MSHLYCLSFNGLHFYQGHRNSFRPVINLLLHFPGTSTLPYNPRMITSSSSSYLPQLLNSPWPKKYFLDSHLAYFHYALLNSVSYYCNCQLNANKGFSEKVMLSLDKRGCLRSCWLGLKRKFQAERMQFTVPNSFYQFSEHLISVQKAGCTWEDGRRWDKDEAMLP